MMILNNREVKLTEYILPKWQGTPISYTYGGKAVLDYKGEPVFAEIYALRIFLEKGYEGVWVDTYGRKFRTGMSKSEDIMELPESIKKRFYEIHKDGKLGGTWDLLLWKDSEIKFVELKKKGEDKIRATQIAFLEKALSAGHSIDAFELYEWELEG